MYAPLVTLGLLTGALAALVTFLIALRYGTKIAVALPITGLLATIALIWLRIGHDLRDGAGIAMATIAFGLPMLAGVGLGALLGARLRRSRKPKDQD